MTNLASVTTNFFTVASETFTDNLSASISAGAATVPVNNASEYAEGDRVVLTVDPGTVNEATFIGVKDTGNQFINCKWTEGNTAVGHDSGATIIDYDSATHHGAQSKGILEFADQDGNLLTQAVRDALNLGATDVNGWEVLPYTVQVASNYNKSNKSFEASVPNNDLTDELSPGMRLRLQRGTTAPTQCADFESSSSQYGSKTSPSGHSYLDDFTVETHIKLESYPTSYGSIASRYNGTSGWELLVDSFGRLLLVGHNSGSSNYRSITSINTLPLNKWVHVAAILDMSGYSTATSKIYIDGADSSAFMSQSGSNPTAILQAGNLEIGSTNGGTNLFDGKISDLRIWSVARTALQIKDNMYQQLVGTETNIVGYWKLNGDLNDSTTNANHLTGSGGLVATTIDNPFQDTIYAIITKIEFSSPNTLLTISTPTGIPLPNMSLTAPYYSTEKIPFGFPADKNKWRIESSMSYMGTPVTIGALNQWFDALLSIFVPVGAWDLGIYGTPQQSNSIAAANHMNVILETGTPTNGVRTYPIGGLVYNAASVANSLATISKNKSVELSVMTAYKVWVESQAGGGAITAILRGDYSTFTLRAENLYV